MVMEDVICRKWTSEKINTHPSFLRTNITGLGGCLVAGAGNLIKVFALIIED